MWQQGLALDAHTVEEAGDGNLGQQCARYLSPTLTPVTSLYCWVLYLNVYKSVFRNLIKENIHANTFLLNFVYHNLLPCYLVSRYFYDF